MNIDFLKIDYLKNGNDRQKEVHSEITSLNVFTILKKYHPVLTGTIPIEIDLPDSDLDIICECDDHKEFAKYLTVHFGQMDSFRVYETEINGIRSTVANFRSKRFTFEIFGQNSPTEKQNAFKHMIIEHKILIDKGSTFKKKIIDLKEKGLKTEPAFAKVLGLEGNPYDELLKLEKHL